MKISPILVASLLAVWAEASTAEVKPTRCEGCHNGNIATKLGDLTSQQIAGKLNDFKSGKTVGNVMPTQAKNLSEDDIRGYALHFGKPEAKPKTGNKK